MVFLLACAIVIAILSPTLARSFEGFVPLNPSLGGLGACYCNQAAAENGNAADACAVSCGAYVLRPQAAGGRAGGRCVILSHREAVCRYENVDCIAFVRRGNESHCATQCHEMPDCLAFEFFVPTGESEAW
jgi:hypothetical protein